MYAQWTAFIPESINSTSTRKSASIVVYANLNAPSKRFSWKRMFLKNGKISLKSMRYTSNNG
ncbi:hypothetical protein GBAR_LOCUS22886 [Geodia barretti]|uniref:Uncharacterized protein n=1 Tax=Geodia barretti TaxID=519541 RepID=A0AA35T4L6_GEOBA|nr:hypothetical protein GBAR_LOCUS22886 [Geodia barretti]